MLKQPKQQEDIKDATAAKRKAAAYAERARRKRRQNYYFIGAIVVAVLVVIFIIAYMNRPVEIADLPDDLDHYAGLPASVTETGMYRLGAEDAPVLLEEFSSFTCPHCAAFHEDVGPRLLERVESGELAIILYPLANSQQAAWGTRAAVCAGQQDPLAFWQMSDVAFSWLGELAYGQRHLETAAAELGLDVGALGGCMMASETTDVLQNIADHATEYEVGGTPAIFFNGERPICNGGEANPNCEGNLGYEVTVQNIDIQLEKAAAGAETEAVAEETGDAEADVEPTEEGEETSEE